MTGSFVDHADWDGVDIRSVDVGGGKKKSPKFTHAGNRYVTRGEHLIAIMLHRMGIAFTPNVRFDLTVHGEDRNFVPDFIFDRAAWLWHGSDGPLLIHGLEAKGRTANSRTRQNYAALYRQRGIRVHIIFEKEILESHRRARLLPLSRLP